ncbi:hypothetical protein OHB53_09595 [Streptomyces sp. NBC_00056]|uniref:hypothetical protein n=1 Tax=Streptomyces sp. NBC_00056 TaxID=2975633 RepID=UPI00325523DD
MQVNDMLRILNVDPGQLPPAPGHAVTGAEAFARIGRNPQPCVSCGRPATSTSVADVPEFGPRWIDKCTPHMIASTKTGGTRALRVRGAEHASQAAVRQTGVEAGLLTAPPTEAECARG